MREHDRLGAAVAKAREQFERAAAAGLEVAMRAAAGSGGRHVARLRWRSEDHGLRGPHMATPFLPSGTPPASRQAVAMQDCAATRGVTDGSPVPPGGSLGADAREAAMAAFAKELAARMKSPLRRLQCCSGYGLAPAGFARTLASSSSKPISNALFAASPKVPRPLPSCKSLLRCAYRSSNRLALSLPSSRLIWDI